MSYQGNIPPIPSSSWAVNDAQAQQQGFVTRVYGWMAAGLALSAAVAGAVASNAELTYTINATGLRWVLLIALLGLVMAISWGINRISAATATALFLLF